MLQRKSILLLLVVLYGGLSFTINTAFAHPGKTAADGCHYCRTNCAKWGVATGERHCHGDSASTKEEVTPISTPASKRKIDDMMAEKIVGSMAEYRADHSGYRERFIEKLLVEWNGTNNSQIREKVAALVYRLLPDIK